MKTKRISLILRSKTLGVTILGRFEGLWPFKHVGVLVEEENGLHCVHEVQKSNWYPLSKIKIRSIPLYEFCNNQGYEIRDLKELDYIKYKESISRFWSFDGKPYVFGLCDCDRAAGVFYYGTVMGWIFHRQLYVYLLILPAIFLIYSGWLLANGNNPFPSMFSSWSMDYPCLKLILYSLTTITAIIYYIYFFFHLNNTKK